VTVSILEALAVTPTGQKGLPLGLGSLGWYLRQHCDQPIDKQREQRHRKRDALYRDGGVEYLLQLIDKVFKHQVVKELRAAWAPYAGYNNAMKRVINELSSVYSEPAKRSVNEERNDAAYHQLLEDLQFDTLMQEVNRLYNLHRVILVGFRVRERPDGEREPVVSIITPAQFRVVVHPNDQTLVLGYLIRTATRPMRGRTELLPAWVLWTDHERVQLTEEFAPIPSTYLEHGFGLCPYVPIVRAVGQTDFWPGEEGEDLCAAAIAIRFANLLNLKETKSATRQAITTGAIDGTRGQASDIEVPTELPEGASMAMVDLSMDLSLFRDTSDHILDSVANDYGISASLVRHQGVQSGDARELMRVPIRELRREQQPMFRLFERRFAAVKAAVLRVDLPRRAFLTEGWSMGFGEGQTPLTRNEELDAFERERQLGLDNVVDFLMRRDPDLDEDQARAIVQRNVEVSTWHVGLLREFQALAGAVSTSVGGAPGQATTPATEQEPADNETQEGKAA
jgi:hypothetical protein